LDPRIPDGLTDIRARWTLDDVVVAHQYLDQMDAVEAKRRAKLNANG
jgi:hypothetical protein